MMFDLKNLYIKILKQFDGNYNYFNPSHYRGKTICRRQSKIENKILVSDIIDVSTNCIILSHYIDDNYIWSYEDARLINHHEFGVCVCKLDKTDITKIINVHYKKYNINSKTFIDYKTQNAHFEKHWQFINDNIISMIEHEDVDTINTLLDSQTVTNDTTGKTIGNIVEEIKNAINNATINDATSIETAILNTINNNNDPTTDNNIITMLAYEDQDTINTLLESQTITNETTGLKVGDIIQ